MFTSHPAFTAVIAADHRAHLLAEAERSRATRAPRVRREHVRRAVRRATAAYAGWMARGALVAPATVDGLARGYAGR